MPYSYNETVASGSTDEVTVPFGYISRNHVHVLLDGEEVEQSTLEWLSANTIKLPETPEAGVAVVVRRQTPLGAPLVVFTPSVLNARHLNILGSSLLYMVQEAVDQVVDVRGLVKKYGDFKLT